MNDNINKPYGEKKQDKKHCTAFCPECGSDLYYLENQCICKNKNCNWTCSGCKED
ncbi:hypothetical protein [Xylanivirga thermophila]|uniref:hypothetical protein n=1 Tax=Xylanivirga thermophila TaxID=2496273 RepID=UPI0013E9D552|nr:hypothetical protein [Xylanivirga thermophila]